MLKLESMTAAQAQSLVEWRARWFAIGSSTERADRPRAEAAIVEMYRLINEPAPQFLWTDSPATGALAGAMLRNAKLTGASLWDSLRDSLRDSLGASLGASLWASLWDSLWDSLGDSLWASLRDSLGASLGASLWDSLWASLWDSLRDSLGDSLRDSLRDSLGASLRADPSADCFWGSHEVYWSAYYAFARDELDVKYDPTRSAQLDLWSEVGQSCGWWWPYKGLVIASERPTRVCWETDRERPRLHSAIGPALEYADGWKVHCWRGVRVPGEWIEKPNDVPATSALTHPNIEQRRALAEILGWKRVLEHVAAREIDRDADPRIGTLIEADLPDAPRQRFLRVLCGTGREFVLPVDPALKTARAANAWSFGLSAAELHPEVRT